MLMGAWIRLNLCKANTLPIFDTRSETAVVLTSLQELDLSTLQIVAPHLFSDF